MQVNNRYGVLFDKVRIGPVTAPNRFYQVPHCTGMGYARPKTLAAMRATKAEGAGGWSVPSIVQSIRVPMTPRILMPRSGTMMMSEISPP